MDEALLRKQAKQFDWYTPVNFGNGLIINGNFKISSDDESIHFGLGKWRYIVERNLPDLQGKRVLDIGCNAGAFCIQMARMGATEVIGIDSNRTWPNWLNQAKFVKSALEWRCGTTYPITFIDSEMDRIPDLNLGHFDVVIALCCLYYLEGKKIQALLEHFNGHSDIILIQCNTRRADQSTAVHRRASPKYMVHQLQNAGYSSIHVDNPLLYERPIVVGSKHSLKRCNNLSKLDRLRLWTRSKI